MSFKLSTISYYTVYTHIYRLLTAVDGTPPAVVSDLARWFIISSPVVDSLSVERTLLHIHQYVIDKTV